MGKKREETFRRAIEEDPSPGWTGAIDVMWTEGQDMSLWKTIKINILNLLCLAYYSILSVRELFCTTVSHRYTLFFLNCEVITDEICFIFDWTLCISPEK